MAAQGWYNPSWISPDWVADNWMAANTSIDATAQLVAVQAAQTALFTIPLPATAQFSGVQAPQTAGSGAARWVAPDWVSIDWVGPGWLGGPGGWQLTAAGAITGPTADWVIPALEIAPLWTVSMGAGIDTRLIGVQLAQTGLLSAQFITVATDRTVQLVGLQAPQTLVALATFTPSITQRDSLIAASQAPQVGLLTATHVISGLGPDKRYGRKS